MTILDSIHTNILADGEVSGRTPDAEGDFYLVTDAQADHNYWHERIVDSILASSSTPTEEFLILHGGIVSDNGSGQLDISECLAIGKNSSGDRRLIRIPALTNVPIPTGWNDGRNIWAIARHDYKLGSATRTHRAGTSYHYQVQDTYFGDSNGYVSTGSDNLFTDSDPSATDTILAKFTMTGTTFADLYIRSAEFRPKENVEFFGNISNNTGSPNTIIDFGVGKSWSDDYTTWIADVVGMSKTSGAWSAGTGNGMLDTGSFAASKVYYLYRILNPTTSAVDYLMSLSDTSPTMPSGYTKKRLIGAVLTNSSIQFIPSNFSRPTKDIFRCDYKTQQNDRPEAAAGNLTRNLLTVSAPINSLVLCSAAIQSNSSSGNIINFKLGSTFETDLAPSPLDNDFAVVAVTGQTAGTPSLIYQRASGNLSAIVDSNRQIYWRISNESTASVRIGTKAWQLSI